MTWIPWWFQLRTSIGNRLRLAFALPLLLVLAGSAVILWQFVKYEQHAQDLALVDRQITALSWLQQSILSFSDQAVQLLESRDLGIFEKEITALQTTVLKDLESAESILRETPEKERDEVTLSILAMLHDSLKLRVETLVDLARVGDQAAIQMRLERHQRTLQGTVRRLIRQIEELSTRNREEALTRMREARNQAIWILLSTAILSLFMAGWLHYWLMHSVRDPLERLDQGAQHLAAGEFDYRISITGQDELARLGGVLNDASARLKELYLTLQRSENHFRSLIENATDLIMVLSGEGRIQYMSPSSARILGKDSQTLFGCLWIDQLEKKEQSKWATVLQGSLPLPGHILLLELPVRHAEGGVRYLEMLLANQLHNPAVNGIVVNARDISERVIAREKLETLNAIGRTVSANLSVEGVFSSSALQQVAAAANSDITVAFLMEGDRLSLKKEFLASSIADGHTVDFHSVAEYLCACANHDGQPIYCSDILQDEKGVIKEYPQNDLRAFAVLPLTVGGEILGLIGLASFQKRNYEEYRTILEPMIGTIAIGLKNALLFAQLQDRARELQENLDEIKRAEDSNRQLRQQLQQIQKLEAIGTLAGGIAHDFNNILSAIIGYTELALLEIPKDSPSSAYLQQVFHAGNRARNLVKQILAFSRQNDLEKKPIQMRGIAVEALSFLRASLPTTIEIHENLESRGMVLADPTMMYQVLLNLCTNAAHAMKEKGGVLRVELKDATIDQEYLQEHPDLKTGKYLRLIVGDTGCGMSAQVLNRIFDPFFTTKKKEEGTGLGLSVVHGIIKSYGGSIVVYSEPGKGSTFNVFLPTLGSDTVEAEVSEKKIPTGTERVLFVDDEPAIIDLSEMSLRSLGYQVTTCQYPVHALEMIQEDPTHFDMVITDLTMPKMTGLQLAENIFKIRKDMPIILCTGFSSAVDDQTAQTLGIKAILQKPTLIRELAEQIRAVLSS